MTFRPVPSRSTPARREAEVLAFWNETDPFAQTQEKHAPDFVFYEGPPTANGRPHIGHMVPRALKDLVCRYQSMTGHRVLRKAGWDTHGLPVELEVEKALGLSGKPQVEAYGVAAFNQKCRESVWTYKREWETTATERAGYWLDTEHPYVTYDDRYVESVWWALRQIWDKGMLYQGHKVLPYCPRCGTALSSHEVAQGYQEVEDPALTVRFPVTSPGPLQGASLLAWTTTPWTLPANLALAVRPDAAYALAELADGERVVALRERLPEGATVVSELTGRDLEGLSYEPPFPWAPADGAHRVLTAPWVEVDQGTGIVHIAPAFGEDDARLGAEQKLPFFCPVDDQGRYTAAVPPWTGKFVKTADPLVTKALQESGRLFRADRVQHTYPFCWRCDTPLLYMARAAWFVRTTALKERLLAANATVEWHPDHFRDGRFGNFLENLIDWCVSRERYWGTPLPLWQCRCGHRHVVGSLAELEQLAGGHVPDVHRPGIDAVTFACPHCGGEMRRVPEVLDVWFDSGCMPFAQHHYPFENAELFRRQFPADFICEAVDQTRGWFYLMLVISVALCDRAPYRRVLVTEFGLDERGKKMSKSRRNVVDLGEVLEQYGADALRLYVYSSGQPWLPKRIGKQEVAEAGRVLETLHNVYAFFVLYANLERWEPGAPEGEPALLDRWLLSRLQSVTAEVGAAMDGFDVPRAARALTVWIDDLSNWYVRLSRRRFWDGGPAGRPAFAALYRALTQTARLLAPFCPFLAETIHRNLCGGSVHLQPFPTAAHEDRELLLEERMELVRRYASAGRAARQQAGLKVRQPLAAMLLLNPGADLSDLTDLLKAELNVRNVAAAAAAPVGFVTGEDGDCIAALDPGLTPDLLQEGLAREVVNRLQRYRKELGLAVADRVRLWLDGSPDLLAAVSAHCDYVTGEVQAVALVLGPDLPDCPTPLQAAFDGQTLAAVVQVAAGE